MCASSRTRHGHVWMQLHWSPVKQRVFYKVLWLTFLAAHGKAPEYLCEPLEQRDVKCALHDRSHAYSHVQELRLFAAFVAAGPRLWNALPAEQKNITQRSLRIVWRLIYLEKHMVLSLMPHVHFCAHKSNEKWRRITNVFSNFLIL